MNLEPLPEDVYYDFASKFFEAKKGSFSQQVFHDIYQRFDGYTWYLQAILNRLYEQGKKVETDKQAVDAILLLRRCRLWMWSPRCSMKAYRLLRANMTSGVIPMR